MTHREDPVFLARYEEADLAGFRALLSDASVMARVGGVAPAGRIEALFLRARASAEGDFIRVIRRAADGAYLGHAALFRSAMCAHDEREILFYLAAPYWGRGYAAAAGRQLLAHASSEPGISRVWATIDTDHAASIATCRKIGMLFDRTGRDEDGEFLIFAFP